MGDEVVRMKSMRMGAWVALVWMMASTGCFRNEDVCATSEDCFLGEVCTSSGSCAPGADTLDMTSELPDEPEDMAPEDMDVDLADPPDLDMAPDLAPGDMPVDMGCPPGTSELPAGGCEPILCAEHFRVDANACTACALSELNAPGDDASGQDTVCDDACQVTFGVSCDVLRDTYIKASNTSSSDGFGTVLALDGDILVVGAPIESSSGVGIDSTADDDSSPSSGAAYVFSRAGGAWTQLARIKAPNPSAMDSFGLAVAVSGDLIAIGAPGESSNTTGVGDPGLDDDDLPRSGAVYVYEISGGVQPVTFRAFIKSLRASQDGGFGFSLAMDGNRLAVGSPGEGGGTGNAYVFELNDLTDTSSWVERAFVGANFPDAGDRFGEAVSLRGDLLAVGAPGEASNARGIDGDPGDDSDSRAGAAYVFRRRGSGFWEPITYLKSPAGTSSNAFGFSLAMTDAYLVVGSYNDRTKSRGIDASIGVGVIEGSGSATVFAYREDEGDIVWTQGPFIKSPAANVSELCGWSVAASGNRFVLGCTGEDSSAVDASRNDPAQQLMGSCSVFVVETDDATGASGWGFVGRLKASNARMGSSFGSAVALDGDILIVGSSGESSASKGIDGDEGDMSAPGAGAVYVRKIAPDVIDP